MEHVRKLFYAAAICPQLSQKHQKLLEIASKKGSSSWLVALPMECHGFSLHKGAFRDALSLRCGWQPSKECVCGKSFNVDHALNCSTGGFPTIRHNKIRDFTAKLLTEVCHNVCVEPPLQVNTSHMPQQIGSTMQDWMSRREDSGEHHISVPSSMSGFSTQTQA